MIRSDDNRDIVDVKVMGRDRYVMARTAESLLLGDIATSKVSEVRFGLVNWVFNTFRTTSSSYGCQLCRRVAFELVRHCFVAHLTTPKLFYWMAVHHSPIVYVN